ncbi:MAG: hypothetical protein CXR31_03660 [Geobacter sp.]|nr:MAG: hypothetical protein CXR31_03660 [Geobacter sp.]
MLLRLVVIAMTGLVLASCHGYIQPRFDAAHYPRTYKQYDLTLFWRVDRAATGYTIEGFARNTRFVSMHDLEVTATLLDGKGKKLSEATFFFFPNQLPMDEAAPFTLNLPLSSGETPEKLRLFYRYRAVEGGDGDKILHFQSFEVEPH